MTTKSEKDRIHERSLFAHHTLYKLHRLGRKEKRQKYKMLNENYRKSL